MIRITSATIILALGACAVPPAKPVTTAFDGAYHGPVTLSDGSSKCFVPDREFAVEVLNGRALHGWPFIPDSPRDPNGIVGLDGKLTMTGRAYQTNLRVEGQVIDGVYDAVSHDTCTYSWHLTKQ